MTDYDGTLTLKFWFNFSKNFIRKLSYLGFKKEKINNQSFEIIRGIQILALLKNEKNI